MSSFCGLVFFVMLSIYVINKRGDKTHPCFTPDVTFNGFDVPFFVWIMFLHLPYKLVHILIRWAFTPYCSNPPCLVVYLLYQCFSVFFGVFLSL
jgi:hypothetical protein